MITKIGDIVCYCSSNKLRIGKVVRIEGSKSLVIVPTCGGHVVKRKTSEVINYARLLKLTEKIKL